jgi:serine/threonine protein kinase
VLGFIDSTDLEDQLILVTEYCTPLSVWLSNQLATTVTAEDRALLFEECLWGFKCVLTALSFLHTAGNMTHGYLGPHAIFVCKTGDWKLGAFELSANSSNSADTSIVLQHGHLLERAYQAPERKIIDEAALRNPVGSADIYSLSQVSLFSKYLCTRS